MSGTSTRSRYEPLRSRQETRHQLNRRRRIRPLRHQPSPQPDPTPDPTPAPIPWGLCRAIPWDPSTGCGLCRGIEATQEACRQRCHAQGSRMQGSRLQGSHRPAAPLSQVPLCVGHDAIVSGAVVSGAVVSSARERAGHLLTAYSSTAYCACWSCGFDTGTTHAPTAWHAPATQGLPALLPQPYWWMTKRTTKRTT